MEGKDPDVLYAEYLEETFKRASEFATRRWNGSKSLRMLCEGARTYRISKQRGSPNRSRSPVKGLFDTESNLKGANASGSGAPGHS
jgi:hypothetical protein